MRDAKHDQELSPGDFVQKFLTLKPATPEQQAQVWDEGKALLLQAKTLRTHVDDAAFKETMGPLFDYLKPFFAPEA